MSDQLPTKDKILHAAMELFVEKGKSATRMHEIADLAGVNKAMIFYYFNSKDMLYEQVLHTFLNQIFTHIRRIIVSDGTPKKKLEDIIDAYINFIHHNPELPKLLMREIADGGHNIRKVLRELKSGSSLDLPAGFLNIIQESVDKGEFRKVDPTRTIISIIGMSLIYFIGKPLIASVFELNPDDESQFIENRKKSILDLLEYGILERE
ncbi:MAG: TetR/AcrR family transcriptional regulator [candidate division KSB1 bacterium]|jgi:AcrR family transcriptional regulator|nr:TetR/AcrR family transcriptional regulator [candidate division KSB1 bacterium]